MTTLTPEELAKRLEGAANDADNWAESYGENRQGKWLTKFATTAREAAAAIAKQAPTIRILDDRLALSRKAYDDLEDENARLSAALRSKDEEIGRLEKLHAKLVDLCLRSNIDLADISRAALSTPSEETT